MNEDLNEDSYIKTFKTLLLLSFYVISNICYFVDKYKMYQHIDIH